ncbi:hyoscyamine 6-dioxygenase-like [Beta vulgaris subsp. vulgaris]|uniref:hyoscyamine 6-dioxygenase-like n=1 Tax=Beta vulgaris subsp. vulgaris TaxID=3555 RepID=UPI002549A19D|nr:hyoscyamine 6-dioxygenase-like [Beta vulgaris subsp. vulgaris]
MTSFQWATNANALSLTPKFIVPDENKPTFTINPHSDSISIIDMNEDNEALVQRIAKLVKNLGFFQVINHGISMELCNDELDVIKNFFQLSYEEKAHLVSPNHMEDGKIFNFFQNSNTGIKLACCGCRNESR